MSALLNPSRAPVAADSFHEPIADDLLEVERILHCHLSSARPGVARLLSHLDNYRGKRLRPALLLLTARACGTVAPAHHVLAAVVEMIHTATLVHDDVLDSASVRRHAATVNAAWGNQASILLGDYLFTHAFHLCSTLDDPRACRIIGESTNRVCAGELHQISARGNLCLGEEEYLAIIDAKTAELTSCCCRLGALFANVPAETVELLASFGRYLGLSFQIADDLLDLVGDENRAGKSLGTDLDQQKLTLPLIRLLARAPEAQANRVRQVLRQQENHKREALAPDLASSGAVEEARATAEEFARRARRCLECLPASESRDLLAGLTVRVVHRQA
ncbi:MAG: polyprenyl synthetase family protein [Planctomycetes bacterium]|nr:polyprenyl synthetase family protein [Planctomycetota bacterium]